jgi:outer membrane protein assembly factor BamB
MIKLFEFTRQTNPWISAIFARDLGGASSADGDFSLLNPDGSPRPAYKVLRDYYARAWDLPEQIKGTDLTMLWQYWPNATPSLTPVLGPDGAIYTINIGYVRVLDPNGAFRLSMKADRKNVPGVAVDTKHMIYASGETGALSAYTAGGNLTWSVLTDGTASTTLLISADEQALYTGTSKRQLDAYATDDGHKIWGTPLGGNPGALALGGDGTIFVGSSDGALHAIAPDGTPRWSYPSEGWVRAAPLISATAIYAVTDKGVIFALDSSGAQRWSADLGGQAAGLASGPDGTLYATTLDGTLHALAPDGRARWSTHVSDRRPTAPAAGLDGRIYVGAEDGGLRVVAPDGKIAGVFDAKAPLRIAPLVGRDGAVYVLAGDRKRVFAFGTAALKERYNAL